ncbi:T9SS type A sorting domain-containing protein [Dokdonia ponticola]|uniref:T9SS type A sorting domain-containing protein n=1 Tax=Dokdonia ponticola TaxID=2041041 RepID=A0ABV9HW34_9FLAO
MNIKFLNLASLFFIFIVNSTKAQNLMDTASWTLGSGSVTGYYVNGSSSENWRVLGEDHLGRETILWEARNDVDNNADGGWNASSTSIDNTKTYRFAVWIKKTNSHDGKTYFGCLRTNGILSLNNTVNNNPYFWTGDLPELDRWYLLIGYVHHKDYSASGGWGLATGAIYDGLTGLQVQNLTVTDFKFSSTATSVSHRAYLYYDVNINDRQYFMNPRLEEVNGQEPTILELLEINQESTLTFNYDASGNQIARYYCAFGTNCMRSTINKEVEEEKLVNNNIDILEEEPVFLGKLSINPNPTKGVFNIYLGERNELTSEIYIYDLNGRVISSYSNKKTTTVQMDITDNPSGVYIVHVHFENGEFISKRIIKD